MTRRIFYLSVLFLVLAFSLRDVRAQSEDNKFEVGGQVTILRMETRSINPGFGSVVSTGHESVFGFGGRAGYNFSRYFTAEAELNFFPQDDDIKAGRKTQGLVGVKAGKRFD